MIHGAETTLQVRKLTDAVEFYRDVLGLLPAEETPISSHTALLELGGGAQLRLLEASPHFPAPGQSGSIGLSLKVRQPLEQVLGTLESRGVSIRSPIVEEAGLRLVHIGDPDSNDLCLVEDEAALRR